jgi:PTH1 family peptidyl-tRNA hydrolase
MALFTKDPIESSKIAPLYTIGSQRAVLILGLGNPGKEYEKTRHNIGFEALDAFVEAQTGFGGWLTKKDLKAVITTATLGSKRVIAMKPTTFMNLSGEAVQAVQAFYKIPSSDTVVIYDELDLEFGQIRTRTGGGAAGHNGIKSLIQHTGDQFHRVRIGINSPHRTKNAEKDFVLKQFSQEEQGHLKDLHREVTAILTEYIYGGQLPADTRSFLV